MFTDIFIVNLASVVSLDAFIYDEIFMAGLLFYAMIRFG
jgi:hypothetical protein